jgi:hypothetical protein
MPIPSDGTTSSHNIKEDGNAIRTNGVDCDKGSKRRPIMLDRLVDTRRGIGMTSFQTRSGRRAIKSRTRDISLRYCIVQTLVAVEGQWHDRWQENSYPENSP